MTKVKADQKEGETGITLAQTVLLMTLSRRKKKNER